MDLDAELPTVCLYETLGAERNASADEIKALYRKQALKWHPDKIQQSGASPQECKAATVKFQAISHAYEVLSDPQERAWYDSHRSAILSSSKPSAASSTASSAFDYDVDLFPFFSPSAYSGFGDSGKAFYAVYEEIFQKLHDQERSFARAYGGNVPERSPGFGSSSSPHVQVLAFYKFWQSFSTLKDFSWCDEYKVSAGPNRKSRRLMEEENLKIRKAERREFNDTVRQLASYVKKRDKRVLKWQLEQQRQQKEKDEMLKLRKKRLEEEKRARLLLYEEEEWTKPVQGVSGMSSDDEEEQEELQEFFCIICNKRFKSVKQWQNHEKSKKHILRVEALKNTFEEEDGQVEEFLANKEEAAKVLETTGAAVKDDTMDDLPSKHRGQEKSGYLHPDFPDQPHQNDDPAVGSGSEDEEESMLEAMLSSQRNRSQGFAVHNFTSSEDEPSTSVHRSKATDVSGGKRDQNRSPKFTADHMETEVDGLKSAMLGSSSKQVHVTHADDDSEREYQKSSLRDHAPGLDDDLEKVEIVSGDEDDQLSAKGAEIKEATVKSTAVRGAKAKRRARQEKKQAAAMDRFSGTGPEVLQQQQKQDKSSAEKGHKSNIDLTTIKVHKKNSRK